MMKHMHKSHNPKVDSKNQPIILPAIEHAFLNPFSTSSTPHNIQQILSSTESLPTPSIYRSGSIKKTRSVSQLMHLTSVCTRSSLSQSSRETSECFEENIPQTPEGSYENYQIVSEIKQQSNSTSSINKEKCQTFLSSYWKPFVVLIVLLLLVVCASVGTAIAVTCCRVRDKDNG